MDNSQNAVNIFNKYAKYYQDKFMDTELYHDTFDLFCNLIQRQEAEVLELACGPGNITKYLLFRRPDLKILGTDLAPNMVELAKLNNPFAKFEVMDTREISRIDKKFDAIMCGFCLPYLTMEETAKLISDSAALLNSGAPIYISTMEDAYTNSGFRKGSTGDELFMHYYMENDLTKILLENNFRIVDVTRKKSTMTDNSVVTDLIILAVNQ